MSESHALRFDFLAKGLTTPSVIIGVPYGAALINFSINFFLGFISCLALKSILPMAAFASTLAGMHIVMMKLCLKDVRALDVLLKTPCGQGGEKEGFLNTYSPCETTLDKASLVSHQERTPSRFIPYDVLIDDNTVSTKDGLLMQFLTMDGIAFSTCDDMDIDVEKELRNHFLNQIKSPNVMVHFYLKKRKASAYPKGETSNAFAREFNAQYKAKLKDKNFFEHQYYLVLIHKSEKNALTGMMSKVEDFFNGKGDAIRDTMTDGVETLNALSDQLLALFESQNIRRLTKKEGEQFSESEPLGFLSEILNAQQRNVREPTGPISTHLAYKNHHFARRKGVVKLTSVDGSAQFAAMLSLSEYPGLSRAGLFDSLLTLKCELLLSQSFIFKTNKNAIKKVVEQGNRMAQSEASIGLTEELILTIEEIKSGNVRLGGHNLSMCVLAESEGALNQHINAIDALLTQKAGLTILRERSGIEAAFWSLLPGNLKYALRESDISSANFAGFMSPHNHPKGKLIGNHWGNALLMLETNAGTSYAFNYHVGQVATTFLVGPSGTGKTSVLASTLITSTKYDGWRFVFDRDFGMSTTVRALGGSYGELKVGVKTGMAPLQLEETAQSRAFNVVLLKRLLSKGDDLSASDEKRIETVIDNAYALDKSDRTFKNIAPFFGVATEGSLRERFDRWHSSGANAWVFDNESDNFDIGSKIYGLDVTKLLGESCEEVKTPIFMYLFERIGHLLDGSPTMIFIPEGWQVMQDKLFSAQIDAWSRTNRKNNVALIIDTQSMGELSKSEQSNASRGGSAMAREAVTTIFFANPKASPNEYEAFNLTDKEFSILKDDLPSRQSEHYFLLRQDNQSVVARLPLHGMNEMLDVISPSKANILIANEVALRISNEREWLIAYHQEIKCFHDIHHQNIESWKQDYKDRV